ncbi:hypothetical protein NL676_030726 [Syzygium grande]|nr:hypothetical protein NL676_030726 [Syzygium grande]
MITVILKLIEQGLLVLDELTSKPRKGQGNLDVMVRVIQPLVSLPSGAPTWQCLSLPQCGDQRQPACFSTYLSLMNQLGIHFFSQLENLAVALVEST